MYTVVKEEVFSTHHCYGFCNGPSTTPIKSFMPCTITETNNKCLKKYLVHEKNYRVGTGVVVERLFIRKLILYILCRWRLHSSKHVSIRRDAMYIVGSYLFLLYNFMTNIYLFSQKRAKCKIFNIISTAATGHVFFYKLNVRIITIQR